jgi:hypothetical protein
VDAAGKSTNCQILTTTTGGHRPLLAGTQSCRGATLYRHMPNVCCHNDCPSNPERPSITITGPLHYYLTPEIAAPLRQRLVLVNLENWRYSFGFFPSSISFRSRFALTRVSGAELRDSRDRSWRRLRTGRSEHPLGSSQLSRPLIRQTCFNLDLAHRCDFSTTLAIEPGLLMTIAFDGSTRP